ncbi:MAG: hypothetical protein K9L68_10295 [Spirochaetales bacterium]|nr:hypothetical protein [Spirochaetales bacterium]
MIGGLGDPASGVGRIDVYYEDGRLLREFSLIDEIPNLEDMSRSFSQFPNLPWVSKLGFVYIMTFPIFSSTRTWRFRHI